jgi:Ca2+-binding EF-hand superfamily protein
MDSAVLAHTRRKERRRSSMIELKLNHDSIMTMFFDDIPHGKNAFQLQDHHMVTTITRNQLTEFMKANNLIAYHHHLKGYEDGKVYGEFFQQ